MELRFALLGTGRIGNVHASAIARADGAVLVVCADALPEAAQALADRHKCQVSTIDQIESAKDVDAVIICTPTDMHADLIERFARAGKKIFCEKPIDLSVARVRQCLDVVEQTNATLMVGFNRRFDPSFAAVRKAIDEGRVGDVELVQITSRDPEAPPVGYATRAGGMLRDMTIHDFDIARFLLDEEPVAVFAHAAAITGQGVEDIDDVDTATILMKTASGKQVSITNSRRSTYGYDQRIEVHGSKGMAHSENIRPHVAEIADASGYCRAPIEDFFMTRYTQAYENEILAFVKCVADQTAPSPSGQDGLAALLLAEAAYKSIAEKRQVLVSEIA